MIHNIDLAVPAAPPVDFGSSLGQNSLWTLHNSEGAQQNGSRKPVRMCLSLFAGEGPFSRKSLFLKTNKC